MIILGEVLPGLAARLRVPSIIFYLLVGVIIGQPGLNIIGDGTFGGALSAIVG